MVRFLGNPPVSNLSRPGIPVGVLELAFGLPEVSANSLQKRWSQLETIFVLLRKMVVLRSSSGLLPVCGSLCVFDRGRVPLDSSKSNPSVSWDEFTFESYSLDSSGCS